MDIAALSVSMSRSSALTNVGTAMLSKSLDTNQVLGKGLVDMIDKAGMERSVNPAVGSRFDMLV